MTGTGVRLRLPYLSLLAIAWSLAAFLAVATNAAVEPAGSVDGVRGLVKAGKYADAEAGARALLTACEQDEASNPVECATILDVLVESRWRSGKAQEPETRELGERALILKEKALGPAHADVAESLNNLAVISFFLGDYLEAEPYWRRALAIRTKALGPDHPGVAQLMNNLGNLYLRTGDFGAALPVYEGALAIRLRVLGEEHPLIGQSYNNMAVLLTETGDYAAALPMAEKGAALYEKLLPPGHPKTAISVQGLARVLLETGEIERGLEMLEKVEMIWEKSLGPEHPDVAAAINNRADQLRKLGRLTESAAAYARALAIWEAAYGSEHPRIALCLSGMGALAQEQGDFDRAIELQQRVLAIRDKTIGERHPRVAVTLMELGSLRFRTGGADLAAPMLTRAFGIRTEVLGPDHPDVAESMVKLAMVQAAGGDAGGALTGALKSEEILREHRRLTSRSLSEQHALRYVGSRQGGLDLALTLAAAGAQKPGARRDVLDSVIRSRAVILDSIAARHRGAGRSDDPEIARLADELAEVRTRLANLTVRGLGGLPPETYRNLLGVARADRERAERALATASVDFAAEQERGRIGLAEVAASLREGVALVSFVSYENLGDVLDASRRAAGGAPARSYVALVLRKSESAPHVIPLGPAEEMEALIATWKEQLSAAAVVRLGPKRSEQEYRKAGENLRKHLWDPLAGYLKGMARVIVVPDGALNLVSLASLPVAGDTYLLERGPLLQYLSAERDLVPVGEDRTPGKGLLALGAPDYGKAVLANSAASASPPDGRTIQTRSACAGFDSLTFEPLPGTAREVEQIVALWSDDRAGMQQDISYLTGPEATEAAFKREAPGRRMLHLATHGFFLGGNCSGGGASTRGVGGVAPSGPKETTNGLDDFGIDNPLLLSGLALAGANRRSEVMEGEDGVLTAEEIATLELAGVDVAVLSACDTGVGEIWAGEGVFGLRRALQIAGVRSQILSLWSVDDDSTQLWMEALYRGLLEEGLDAAGATRAAGKAVLEHRRDSGDNTHPFYWAAFVANGG